MAESRGGRTLSRDFKGVRRHAPAAPGQLLGGWTGFAAGLGVGLAVALGVHVYHRNQETVATEPVPAAAQTPASEAAPDDGAIANRSNAKPSRRRSKKLAASSASSARKSPAPGTKIS